MICLIHLTKFQDLKNVRRVLNQIAVDKISFQTHLLGPIRKPYTNFGIALNFQDC